MTVQQLRNNGYKVKVLHFRNPVLPFKGDFNDYMKHPKYPKGGSTQVIIDTPNGDRFVGTSKCSEQDNYNKKLGVRIALGRSGVFNTTTISS